MSGCRDVSRHLSPSVPKWCPALQMFFLSCFPLLSFNVPSGVRLSGCLALLDSLHLFPFVSDSGSYPKAENCQVGSRFRSLEAGRWYRDFFFPLTCMRTVVFHCVSHFVSRCASLVSHCVSPTVSLVPTTVSPSLSPTLSPTVSPNFWLFQQGPGHWNLVT